jgi:Bacterial Ig domain
MKRLAILVVLLAVALSGGVGRSQAVFVASSAHPSQGFATAPVFNTVAVTLTNPGSPLRSTVTLSATATSPDRTIALVLFQSKRAGGAWTDVCTDTEAPYSCAWDTVAAGDGSYDLRAVARDSNGYEQDSTVTGRQVDNTGPTVTLTNPGSPLTGTETIAATATPTGSAVSSVAIDYRTSPSGTWTQICNDANGPYSCSWNTAQRPDGPYDLRARATDQAGNTSTSATVADRRVDNTAPTVSIPDDGPRSGMATVRSVVDDGAGSGIASVRYEVLYGGEWLEACESSTAPFSCSVDSTQVPDGDYSLRAIATDNAGLTATSATRTVRVDNTAPSSSTLTAVGTPLSGSAVTLGGTAADAGSGVASMRFQYAPAGTTGWVDACTDTTSTYSCTWDTTALADGMYDMRALATDRAGNTLASAVQTNRRVDNVVPAVALTDPGTPLSGSRTLNVTAGDGGGIASMVLERKLTSGGTWTTIPCSDTTSPYSCPWDTTTAPDGTYDLRATVIDNAGRTATSLVSARVVGNGPRATTVAAANGGTSGRLSNGDSLTLTYNEAPLRSSLSSGWTSGSRDVSIAFTASGGSTTVTVSAGAAVPIGTLTLARNLGTVTFNGTMTLTGAVLRLQLGTLASGTTAPGTMPVPLTWTSAASTITDAAGNVGAAATVTGSGQL